MLPPAQGQGRAGQSHNTPPSLSFVLFAGVLHVIPLASLGVGDARAAGTV